MDEATWNLASCVSPKLRAEENLPEFPFSGLGEQEPQPFLIIACEMRLMTSEHWLNRVLGDLHPQWNHSVGEIHDKEKWARRILFYFSIYYHSIINNLWIDEQSWHFIQPTSKALLYQLEEVRPGNARFAWKRASSPAGWQREVV